MNTAGTTTPATTSGHLLQYVWPITDDSHTRNQLIAEATDQLDTIADECHAIITGPPLWLIHDAAQVPGWEAWPGCVLIARIPAEPYGRYQAWKASVDIDHAKVHRVTEGEIVARQLGTAEKVAAVARLAAAGLDDRAIGDQMRWSETSDRGRAAVAKFRQRHAIPQALAA